MIPELATAPPRPKSSRPFISIIAAILAALLLALTTFALLRAGVFYSLYTSLLAKVIETTGLDLWPSRAVALALAALLWFLPWHLLLLPWIKNAKRQVVSLIILAALATAAMEFVTRDVYFSRADGRPLKYYIQTLDGYKFSATPGTDPVYGVPYQSISAEVARDYILWKHRGGQRQDASLPEGQYFNPATGESVRWYARTPEGRLDFFTLPGFHPKYGTKLAPTTPEIVAEYEKQIAEANRQRQAENEKQKVHEAEEAARKTKAEALRKAREARKRKIIEEVLSKRPLEPGRYFLSAPPRSSVDGLLFTLTEIDLTAEKILVHLAVENIGSDSNALVFFPKHKATRYIQLGLLTAAGNSITYTTVRPKEGALEEDGAGSFSFPPLGKHGAFVMEFQRPTAYVPTFSVVANDQPLFSGINLHKATYQPF